MSPANKWLLLIGQCTHPVERSPVELQGAAHDARVSAEPALPEGVTHHGHRVRAGAPIYEPATLFVVGIGLLVVRRFSRVRHAS